MSKPYLIQSVSHLHRLLGLEPPKHPLVSVINFADIKCYLDPALKMVVYDFYHISIKKGFKGKMKYGQRYIDFDEGIMLFNAPQQVLTAELEDPENLNLSGYWLIIHPDFIRSYPLGKQIKNYGFFSYAANEALHLSEEEEAMLTTVMLNIDKEHRSPIDKFSQDVIISHIEVLLNYSNRFYHRQFLTRQSDHHDLLLKLDTILDDYINSNTLKGLPTVQYLSRQLNVSPDYLSDMLRTLTGQNTQQHIHNKIIEKAKEILSTTTLSVSEIAYQLGFEYPQSFNKLFKSKTQLSPLAFRQSFK